MEYDVESLIEDLKLPRHIIEEDVEKGRIHVYQHNGDEKHYVDAEDFLEYIARRVVELQRDEQLAFWGAVKKIITDPRGPRRMPPEDIALVLAAIQREVDKLG